MLTICSVSVAVLKTNMYSWEQVRAKTWSHSGWALPIHSLDSESKVLDFNWQLRRPLAEDVRPKESLCDAHPCTERVRWVVR